MGHREEVEAADRLDAVPLVEERGEVSGQRRRVAGDVGDPPGTGGSDGAQTAGAVLLYAVDATLADAVGIVVARGPSIVSRASLAYDATVDDAPKITTKLGQLAAIGIIARDTA